MLFSLPSANFASGSRHNGYTISQRQIRMKYPAQHVGNTIKIQLSYIYVIQLLVLSIY